MSTERRRDLALARMNAALVWEATAAILDRKHGVNVAVSRQIGLPHLRLGERHRSSTESMVFFGCWSPWLTWGTTGWKSFRP